MGAREKVKSGVSEYLDTIEETTTLEDFVKKIKDIVVKAAKESGDASGVKEESKETKLAVKNNIEAALGCQGSDKVMAVCDSKIQLPILVGATVTMVSAMIFNAVQNAKAAAEN